jgi:hypothetical protein
MASAKQRSADPRAQGFSCSVYVGGPVSFSSTLTLAPQFGGHRGSRGSSCARRASKQTLTTQSIALSNKAQANLSSASAKANVAC